MPGFIAKKLCPELVIVPAHFSKYREASETVRDILARYDPNFHSVGLDESYLDLTECVKLRMDQCRDKAYSSPVGPVPSSSPVGPVPSSSPVGPVPSSSPVVPVPSANSGEHDSDISTSVRHQSHHTPLVC